MAFGVTSFGESSYTALSGFNPGATPAKKAARMSAFNFCNPFDHILPPTDSTVSALDRQHLWGLYIGITVAVTGGPVGHRLLLGVGR